MDFKVNPRLDEGRKDFEKISDQIDIKLPVCSFYDLVNLFDELHSLRTGTYILSEELQNRPGYHDNIKQKFATTLYRGILLKRRGNFFNSLSQFKDALDLAIEGQFSNFIPYLIIQLAQVHIKQKNLTISSDLLDSAKNNLCESLNCAFDSPSFENSAESGEVLMSFGYYYLQAGNKPAAKESFLRAQKVFRNIRDIKSEIKNTLNLGKYVESIGFFEEAREKYDLALDLATKNGFPNLKAMAFSYLGISHLRSSSFELAQEYFQEEIKINQEQEDYSHLVSALLNLGNTFRLSGYLHGAENYYFQALELAKDLEDQSRLAKCYTSLGQLFSKQGRLDTALDCLEKAYAIDKGIKNHLGVSLTANILASYYKTTGNLKKAEEFCLESLELKEKIGDKPGLALCWLNLGDIARSHGNFQGALKYYQDSLDVFQKKEKIRQIAMVYNNLGNLYFSEGNLLKATDAYRKALAFDKKFHNPTGEAFGFFNLGKIYLGNRDFIRAEANFSLCFKIGKSINDLFAQAKALEGIAVCKIFNHNFIEGQEFAQKTILLREDAGDQIGRSRAQFLQSFCLLKDGEHKKAQILMRQAYNEKPKELHPKISFYFYFLASMIEKEDGNLASTLKTLERTFALENTSLLLIVYAKALHICFNFWEEGSVEEKINKINRLIPDLRKVSHPVILSFFYFCLSVFFSKKEDFLTSQEYFTRSSQLLERIPNDTYSIQMEEFLIDFESNQFQGDLNPELEGTFLRFVEETFLKVLL